MTTFCIPLDHVQYIRWSHIVYHWTMYNTFDHIQLMYLLDHVPYIRPHLNIPLDHAFFQVNNMYVCGGAHMPS
jgi:hypothetical protein